jgi:hypothetical protein
MDVYHSDDPGPNKRRSVRHCLHAIQMTGRAHAICCDHITCGHRNTAAIHSVALGCRRVLKPWHISPWSPFCVHLGMVTILRAGG